ncbi:hypothetical protein [Marinobacterium rhizophilum]|uniref:DNA-binding domain-containing protein n=1 Tax=Marinobacterium rhizophilum TaxID=420402 RepID=A0ABY5HJ92_9GAMM|nr:hypothetical protein [Marinobacterium rhizophilum]UTW12448.1 putative DNA-binding domain-containing protein [Marinobacterium rhizophilum]
MRLADLQAALRAEMDGRPSARLRQLVTSASLDPEQCLELYRGLLDQARVRALQQIYPITARLLGQQLLHVLSRLYSQPPRVASGDGTGLFGSGFAQLLESCTHQHCTLYKLQFLPELATLEWALYLVGCAEDDPPPDFSSLVYIPESEQYRLRLVPSLALRLLRCDWPVLDIWNRYQQGNPGELHLSYQPQWLCVYRHLDSPRAERLSEARARLLNGILEGHTLCQLRQAVPDLNQHLTLLISRRWITRFELPPEHDA